MLKKKVRKPIALKLLSI